MGPALVATMVQADADGAQAKKLHPFFTRAPEATPEVPSAKPTAIPTEIQDDASAPETEGGSGRKKRRTEDSSTVQDTPVVKKQRRKRTSGNATIIGPITDHLTKTDHPEQQTEIDEHQAQPIPTPPQSDISTKTCEQGSSNGPTVNSRETPALQPKTETTKTPPKNKKVLKFNPKTGTLGSPPKPKRTTPPSRIVTIKYGKHEENRKEIGRKITMILERTEETPNTPTKRRSQRKPKAPKDEKPQQEGSTKDTHPFFTGKANVSPMDANCPTTEPKKSPARKHTISMATPVSPRKPRHPFAPPKAPNFGSMKPVVTKVPGAMHPAWPSQGMAHVRPSDASPESGELQATVKVEQPRKFKGQLVGITSEDSVLESLMGQLNLESVRDCLPRDENSFPPPPQELRLPTRRFESGRKLQKRVRPQLRTLFNFQVPGQGDSDLDEPLEKQAAKIHPAVARLFKQLESNLSAYDRSTCETCAWTQKYAPNTAAQIVQAGNEASYLKQWLETLKVQAVETGHSEGGGNKSKTKGDKAPKKRRKNKLDGFVVDSDDEDYDLDEVSEGEPDWAPAGSGRLQKTVIRPGGTREQGRLPNSVVISGPHGSGKTAAVYAVAKELGFEVFEINSSSRRSGKDLLEKVGDMTRNHLVQPHQAESTAAEDDTEDQVAKDLKSGKQGMMTAFFKPKTGVKPKKPAKNEETAKDEPKSTPKAQKQSLILLEEVDILYDEDKQFWTTLMGLIAQSKRPFIMTCNDETLVPIQSLKLYGILRFSPPPSDLAADICLLIAANEGHALERSAVEDLYLSRGNDLRAAITELNYWCQIGVGDRRGGFDWFYLRWPKGSDLDENGDVVRVVSDSTYMKGMGWMARDVMATSKDKRQVEEEAMHQCWNSWQLDVGDWHTTLDMAASTDAMSRSGSNAGRIEDLAAYQSFCGALSDSDLCSNGTFGATLQTPIDPTLPQLPTKMKEDFAIGRQLLEADPVAQPSSLECGLSTSVSSLARQDLFDHALHSGEPQASIILAPVDEMKAISILESSFESTSTCLTRRDLSLAFDPIAVSATETHTAHLTPSVFDRTLNLIVLDVAPWVRSIVSYDHRLMLERKRLSSLLSEGGKKKRMRNTRSAYSALEGGERKTTRRERYFQGSVSTILVLNTGLKAWQDAAKDAMGETEESASASPEAMEGLDSE